MPWRRVAAAIGLVVAACAPHGGPTGDETPYEPGHAQKEKPVIGYSLASVPVPAPPPAAAAFRGAPAAWPERTSVELAIPLGDERADHSTAAARAASLPVSVAAVGSASGAVARVRLESFDRESAVRAGVDGMLVRVSRSDGVAARGQVRLTLDYNAFRWAYGGDWASRLRMLVLPDCALSDPTSEGCQGRSVPITNDLRAGTAAAVVDVAPRIEANAGGAVVDTQAETGTLVALVAGPSGPAGDFAATSLAPTATWSAGGNGGDFTWSYALRVPPSLGGPAPSISLDYSAASVDGRMASTNNQPSWIGEGFDWQPGNIERRYVGCADDMAAGANNTTKTGDQCWATDNATLSMPGHAGELIKDGTNPNRWHLRNDDGTFVEHKTGAVNGDNDGEWWVVTTTDGTQYWFGGRSGSNATLTSVVFGNHAGEPCHQTAFKDSSCTQAYRWQLDYVVDTHNNTMTLSYAKETNRYGRNNTASDAVSYDRAGYLTKIEYGTRADGAGSAPARVLFNVSDRCLSGCGTKDAAHWPDVPWDQECTASPCKMEQNGPSFWSTKRLTNVTTQVWDAASAGYRNVESWTLSQSFPDPTDSITGALWLDKISHSGSVGSVASMPDITFAGVVLANRVDTNNDQYPAMNKFRIKTITSETGGKVDVTYSPPDCVKGTRVPNQSALENNNLRCYPVKWTPSGFASPINDFFHKYVATDVTENDVTGGAPRSITHYEYVGDPAWHYTDDDGLVKSDFKTWSVWRGYSTVRITKGDPGEQTRSEVRYFRGMNGDHLPSGTRSVSLPAIAAGNVPAATDEDAYAGMVRETIEYNGPGGAEISATANEPWQSPPTATRTINGIGVSARFAQPAVVHARTALDGGRPLRTTTLRTTFDNTYGRATRVEDEGDDAVSNDETCTLTDYARNTTAWIVDTVSRQRKFAVDCTKALAGGLGEDDVISDDLTDYDGQPNGAPPSKGEVTQVRAIKAYTGGVSTYVTTSTSSYDAYGRLVRKTDVRNNATLTAYTPAAGGPVLSTTETSPLGWIKRTSFEPAWGHPTSTTDANGRRIDMAYDGLGRLTSVWFPGRDRATQSPNLVYGYLLRNDAPVVVTSQRLNPAGGYITSYDFYDSLLRARQSQSPDAAGGTSAVVTDTYYDSAGRVVRTHAPYLAANAQGGAVAPSTNLFVPTGVVPSQTTKTFDGVGRETASIFQVNAAPSSPGGTERWRTTTAYGGDRTDVVPPAGGTATSTLVDARGHHIELRQYHAGVLPGGAVDSSGYDATKYAYDRKDRLVQVTDPQGNFWSYVFDLRGRTIRMVDPDKGTTNTVYDDANDVISTTDGRGMTLVYAYDTIGRKTGLFEGAPAGPKRAEWFYDTLANGTVVSGQLTKSIRYVGTDAYASEYMGFTVDYHPTSVKHAIPASETGLAGSYTYVYTFNPDGSAATVRLPAAGDLALETLTHGYDANGKDTTLGTSLGGPTTYVTGTEYTSFGELGAIHMRNGGGPQFDVVRTFETDTRRLSQIWTTKQTSPTSVADVRYAYDPAGNIVKTSDLVAGYHQCFGIDYLRRLSEAWTPASGDCTAAPALAGLATGALGYWQTFTYDLVGNRTKEVEHVTANGVRTTTYTVPAGNHMLTGLSTEDAAGTSTATYTYDGAGNTLTRPSPGGKQSLTWDAEGHLATSTDDTGTTSFVYDANGNRLIRKDPTGKTLYLPNQELRFDTATSAKTGTRYYQHADFTVAMRTSSGVVWLSGDHHGTTEIGVGAVGQATSLRRQTPFGMPQSASGTWPAAMDKGFVGGTADNTGLTHLGAREYDPIIGRFISVDPIVDNQDPQQMHGYAYGNNDPVNYIDADGRWSIGGLIKKAASAVTTAAKWTYNHADTISTVLGVAAMACTVIPPLQVAAPFLGAAATAFGALAAAKTCSHGVSLDCGMDVAGLIPGGRIIGAAGKGAKYLHEAEKGAELADDAAKASRRAIKGSCDGGFCPCFVGGTPVDTAGGPKAIEAVALGDRVGPELAECSSDELASWREVDLDMTVSNRGVPDDLEIRLLRPEWWIRTHRASVGNVVTVELDDLNVRGEAFVTRVGTSGHVASGARCPATGWVRHTSHDVIPLLLEGAAAPLHVTRHHRLFSVDRADWVHAGDLQPGELLRTKDGVVRVAEVGSTPLAPVEVYNLEVIGAHQYYVGEQDVLAHNNYDDVVEDAVDGPTEAYNRIKHYGRTPTRADRRAFGVDRDQVLDHDPPLAKRYYEGDPARGEKPGYQMTPEERRASGSDRSRMSPQPRSESDAQGGVIRSYSMRMRRFWGLD